MSGDDRKLRFVNELKNEGFYTSMALERPGDLDVQQLHTLYEQLNVDENLICEELHTLVETPNSPDNWISLVAALRRNGERHAALETYAAALARLPKSHKLWASRGGLLLDWQRYDEALSSLQHALQLKPDYAFAFETIGVIFERQHEFKTAVRYYQHAVELDDERAVSWNNMGNCLHILGDDQRA
jgi:tetratricopeptide (TPR) repeat protein